MLSLRLESLAEVFAQVPDPRDPRGIRHPLQGMLTLVFLGLLHGIRAKDSRFVQARGKSAEQAATSPPPAAEAAESAASRREWLCSL